MIYPRYRAVLAEIADRRGLTIAVIVSPRRHARVVEARWEAWERGAEMGYSWSALGRMFECSHSTVLRGVRARRDNRRALDKTRSPKHYRCAEARA